MYKTQKERVLEYLEEHKTITSYECFEKLHIMDLQKAIQLLRNEEHNITDEWIVKDKAKFKKYRLED